MASAGVLALSLADRQAVVPMAAGYLILMSALGFGLRRLYRPPGTPSGGGERPDEARAAPDGPGQRTAWAALVRRVAGTVVGGYLLLMAVVVAYYFGVARVGPGFLESAVTGTALLLGLAAPVFAALSWLTERRRHNQGKNLAALTVGLPIYLVFRGGVPTAGKRTAACRAHIVARVVELRPVVLGLMRESVPDELQGFGQATGRQLQAGPPCGHLSRLCAAGGLRDVSSWALARWPP